MQSFRWYKVRFLFSIVNPQWSPTRETFVLLRVFKLTLAPRILGTQAVWCRAAQLCGLRLSPAMPRVPRGCRDGSEGAQSYHLLSCCRRVSLHRCAGLGECSGAQHKRNVRTSGRRRRDRRRSGSGSRCAPLEYQHHCRRVLHWYEYSSTMHSVCWCWRWCWSWDSAAPLCAGRHGHPRHGTLSRWHDPGHGEERGTLTLQSGPLLSFAFDFVVSSSLVIVDSC